MTCQSSQISQLDLSKLSDHCFIKQIVTTCLAQFTYYIEADSNAVIFDPLRDIEPYLKLIEERKSSLKYIILTHFHADFVAGHYELSQKTGAKIVLGSGAKTDYQIMEVSDGEIIELSDKISLKTIHTPGHTFESSSFLLIEKETNKEIGVFTGDTLFLGEVGRPDLAVKSDYTSKDLAALLYESIQKLKKLTDECVVFPGHGQGSPCGKNIQLGTYSTMEIQKKTNYALNDNLKKEEFIEIATSNISTPPPYFFLDAAMNKMCIEGHDVLIKKSNVPIEVDEFSKLMKTKEINIIDSRCLKSIFEHGIPEGATSIPIDSQFAIYAATLFDIKQKTIVIADEGREEESISRLTRVGFNNILGFLKGGIVNWLTNQHKVKKLGHLSKDESAELITKEKNLYILDVRNQNELKNQGYIKDSQNIPLTLIHQDHIKISQTDHIYILCKSGMRAVMSGSILRNNGFENKITILEGGITSLVEKGVKIDKE